ncbi:uncharacterized protein K460DRAFT_357352 [Cucurbitaria berberidis CBS 394.84]|uniref:Uncharacterized protein n=1 Tax=Cucurbitaria berberidis CBS 394.84 TaxID=1168544 RepID=A0A9P4L713_9PLEO|nr:uncharacterized protein K460DRAFT_357352 [Cucurbitaria berberidis CBS 394.84]KAF1843653.1 hypothetical protein K460DRAFT_357352 [Cucurbitaria berberidis CBS 394.84]
MATTIFARPNTCGPSAVDPVRQHAQTVPRKRKVVQRHDDSPLQCGNVSDQLAAISTPASPRGPWGWPRGSVHPLRRGCGETNGSAGGLERAGTGWPPKPGTASSVAERLLVPVHSDASIDRLGGAARCCFVVAAQGWTDGRCIVCQADRGRTSYRIRRAPVQCSQVNQSIYTIDKPSNRAKRTGIGDAAASQPRLGVVPLFVFALQFTRVCPCRPLHSFLRLSCSSRHSLSSTSCARRYIPLPRYDEKGVKHETYIPRGSKSPHPTRFVSHPAVVEGIAERVHG